MKIFLYYFFRINKIFATKLKKKNKNLNQNSLKTVFIKTFIKNEAINEKFIFYLENLFFFNKIFLNFFFKKKLNLMPKKVKKSFFNFFKKPEEKNNYFKKKKSYSFLFKTKFLTFNYFFKCETTDFFKFLNFFIFFKIFLSNSLINYLNLILASSNKELIHCYYFNYILTHFRFENSTINLKFFNFNKINDFWKINKFISVNNLKYTTVVSNIVDYFSNNYSKKTINLNFQKNNLDYNLVLDSKLNINLFSENFFLIKIFFLKKLNLIRKNKIYNKSRFSRNKQLYRTGVFLCIWLTVLTVLGLYFYFYLLSIKFTYFYFYFIVFIFIFFYKFFLNKKEKHWSFYF